MLITKFNPLLKKYAYKLYYEDAYNDLLTDFIALLHNIQIDHLRDKSERSVVSYIRISVHSCYVKKLIEIKKLKNILLYSDLKDSERYYVESLSSTTDIYHNCEFQFFKKILTKPELTVIYMIFFLGYTVTEIAKFSDISRQAVNQMKIRALKKLRNTYLDKL